MVFESILNPIFDPLLRLPTLWAVIILSFLISVKLASTILSTFFGMFFP